jgi:hypothetical protein
MNETLHSEALSDVPWPTSTERMRVANTSMLPGSAQAPSPAVDLPNRAREDAHDSLDRLADRARPAAQRPGEGVSAAEQALRTQKDPLRNAREAWVGGMRATVSTHPLTSVAVALTLGAVITRITRWGSSPS